MSQLREVIGVLGGSLAAHVARPRHLLLTSAGFVIAGFIVLVMLAIPAGLEALGRQTGPDNIAIVLGAAAQDEAGSVLTPAIVALVGNLPGVARDANDAPIVGPQFVATATLRRKDGSQAKVFVRGVTQATWHMVGAVVHRNTGRDARRGVDELMAGAVAARSYAGLDPGADIRVRDSLWRVTGQFTGGGLWESELWTDIGPLQSAFNANSDVSSLWVQLESPAAFTRFADALAHDARLSGVRAERQRDYYAQQVRFVTDFIRIAALGIALTLGIGAALAVANALNISLIARRRELAVLRALGFRRATLALALLTEVILIGLMATGATILLAWILLDGRPIATSTGNQAIVFTFAITPEVMAWTLAYALILGVASAVWPLHRAVRAPLLKTLGGE